MAASKFRDSAAFLPNQAKEYTILPFRFMRWGSNEVFLSNDAGEHELLSTEDFDTFVQQRLPASSAAFHELKSKHFVQDSSSPVPVELLATKFRTKKSFLDGFTRLHCFVVSLRCDHYCKYCQVSRVTENRAKFDMTESTAERAIDLMFAGPAPGLKVEFQGGESLLNYDLVKFIVQTVNSKNVTEERDIEFVVATNLSHITDEMLEFFSEHGVYISTSLDGPKFLHDANRQRAAGRSHATTVQNIERARKRLGHDAVSALMTTSEESLKYPVEIVDEYVRRGFAGIFMRWISPYGFAVRTGEVDRYDTEAFLEFYRRALDRVIEVNRDGYQLTEIYAQIILQKIMSPFATTYVDLQSPAGTGISAVTYNYDGDVYASDESRMLAEMGDFSFRIGNVHRHSYEAIFGGEVLRNVINASCVEALPGCSQCAFLPFCGHDPVFNWATQRDIVGHRPSSGFCSRNMAIIRHLFELMRGDDRFVRDLFVKWGCSNYAADRLAPEEAP